MSPSVQTSHVEQSRHQNHRVGDLPMVDLVLSSSASILLSCSIFAIMRSISPVVAVIGEPVLGCCVCDCAWLLLCAYISVAGPAAGGSMVQVLGSSGREFGGWFVLDENGAELTVGGLEEELLTPYWLFDIWYIEVKSETEGLFQRPGLGPGGGV